MKRIRINELAEMLDTNEHEIMAEARILLGHWYQFYNEYILGEGECLLLPFNTAIDICNIFGRDPKKVGLTAFRRKYAILLPEGFFIPHEVKKGKPYFSSAVLRYLSQVSLNSLRFLQLRRRSTPVIEGKDFYRENKEIYFTKESALKMIEHLPFTVQLKRLIRNIPDEVTYS